MTGMYKRAYMDALYQAQVERIRKRIETQYGQTLDKMADAVVESFSKMWQSKMAKIEARQELEAKLRKILSEKSKV
jgi:phage-related minor tail protein